MGVVAVRTSGSCHKLVHTMGLRHMAPLTRSISLEEAFKTASDYGDLTVPLLMPKLVNDTPLQGQPIVTEDMLTSLRIKGSVIHQTILRMKVSELNKIGVEMPCDAVP